jgi:1-deoxy-D-xylulose-5-phosphate reductoisomerase
MNINKTKRVVILGCTGSIGSSTLDIIRHERQRFTTVGLSAHSQKDALTSLAKEFNCKATLTREDGTDGIKRLIDETHPDIVVNGIAGSPGLIPSIMVLEAGIDLALANKETIVMAGPLVQRLAAEHHAHLIPVDSEHSAIFSLINKCGSDAVARLIITASGGPFRTWPKEKLAAITLADALKHPTWNMGKKITVDSATLANKGLEVIEACRLFHMSADTIQVVVHPQSIIHSLVMTKDGIVYGQMSEPDMKHPILSALEWPETTTNFMTPFDLTGTQDGTRTLTFEKPRTADFPLLDCAFSAARRDNAYPIAFNAANEIAAAAFIEEKIGFMQIAETVSKVLEKDWSGTIQNVNDVFAADTAAREYARKMICQ